MSIANTNYPINIRPVVPGDTNALIKLFGQLGYPDLSEALVAKKIKLHQQDGYHLLVATDDKGVIGFIAFHWFELAHVESSLGRITSFCVDDRFRGMGIGVRLMEDAEAFMKNKGCTKIEVTTNLRRKETHTFYERRGYGEDSKRFVRNVG